MTKVIVHPELDALPAPGKGPIPVQLYGPRPWQHGVATIGRPVLEAVSRVEHPVPVRAFDFLSLSLAVTAADTFVSRADAADGWARRIELTIALADPNPWRPVLPLLERALLFLSGDEWRLQVVGDGQTPPSLRPRVKNKLSLVGCDCVCLFSGGLDSTIGMLNLQAQGRRPVLVSHAYARDAGRQMEIAGRLQLGLPRFGAVAYPAKWWHTANDVQMRTRSINFLAMGSLMASTMAALGQGINPTLYVPENGLIAINPPLTNRRIGALSTRTTHPYYLGLIQEIWNAVGLPARIENPFAHITKGEMIAHCLEPQRLKAIADRTVSCGKWKRKGKQCGRCVPCLIRRASFHAAGWADDTVYDEPGKDLSQVITDENKRDDLMAMLLASQRLPGTDVAAWVAKTGPLPRDVAAALVDVVHRGMREVTRFLNAENLL
jgi:Queuosine biosynthesis protein QueC